MTNRKRCGNKRFPRGNIQAFFWRDWGKSLRTADRTDFSGPRIEYRTPQILTRFTRTANHSNATFRKNSSSQLLIVKSQNCTRISPFSCVTMYFRKEHNFLLRTLLKRVYFHPFIELVTRKLSLQTLFKFEDGFRPFHHWAYGFQFLARLCTTTILCVFVSCVDKSLVIDLSPAQECLQKSMLS
jgi:hypothetical protein